MLVNTKVLLLLLGKIGEMGIFGQELEGVGKLGIS